MKTLPGSSKFHAAISRALRGRALPLLFLLCALAGGNASGNSAGWEKLEGCRLVSGEWRDGDSFHAKYRGKEYIFRLYFVDTPEDETRFPERIKAQADYFGVKSPRALEIGHMAAEYTHRVLNGKTFSVWTRWEDAMGASQQQRFYAFIEVEGSPLASLLVANGLARIYGKPVTLPRGVARTSDYNAELHRLESRARAQKQGGWGRSSHAGKVIPENGGAAGNFAPPDREESSLPIGTEGEETPAPAGIGIDLPAY